MIERHLRFFALALTGACLAAGCSRAQERPVSMPPGATGLAVAPDFAGTIWATTGRRVFRSRDGGHSWQRLRDTGHATGVTFQSHRSLLVGPAGAFAGFFEKGPFARVGLRPLAAVATPYYRTDRAYAVDGRGRLWVTVSAGRGWSRLRAARLPPGARAVAAVRDDVTRPDLIYVACGARGLWRSDDFGASFRRVAGVGEADAVAATPADPNRLLVAGPRLMLSTDRGRTFAPVGPGGIRASAVAFDARNWRLAFVAIAGGRLLRSADGGETFDS